MNKRKKYNSLLNTLPDLIELPLLLELLGDWGESQVLKMVKNGQLQSIVSPRRGHPHVFPKEYIIDFLCSDFYQREQEKRNEIKRKRCKG